jgi:hypothetical protein
MIQLNSIIPLQSLTQHALLLLPAILERTSSDSLSDNSIEIELKTRFEDVHILEALFSLETFSGCHNSEFLCQSKQFFTELIDFIDHSEMVDFSEVNPESLSLSEILDRIRSFQLFNSHLSEKSGLMLSISPSFLSQP